MHSRYRYPPGDDFIHINSIAYLVEPIESELDLIFSGFQRMHNSNNNNNNREDKVIRYQNGYDVQMKSQKKGVIRLLPGHMKHTFRTFDRPGKVHVLKGKMKVKCGSAKWEFTENNVFKVLPNTIYYVKNNSLLNGCILKFSFVEKIVIQRTGYEAMVLSSNRVLIKLDAGHMKHTYETSDRSGRIRVLRGAMKVKCGTSEWKLSQNKMLNVNPNTTYFAKNNSLLNKCVIEFTLGDN